jgi:carboxypeptidase Taq
VPRSLVQELMSLATTAQQEWSEARRNNDFAQFLPWLTQIVSLKREEAACLAGGGSLYDALLEDFEPGMTTSRLDPLFAAMRSQLVALIDSLPAKKRKKGSGVLKRTYPIDRQRIFIESIAGDLGFGFDCGRLDLTAHPFFSTIGPGDVRITTRFNPADFSEAFFSSLHELGHGLFEQGLPPEWTGLPAGQCQSLALHESQSRFWENCVGRSPTFWEYAFPRAQELFHDALHDVSLDQFLAAVNQVERGWNRVRADEATYNLHIFVRYELEKSLLNGDLLPADLPAAWEERYRNILGVAPPDDAEGCLQDSHWASGQFGYFPTYALGNVFAAHLYEAVRKTIPDLDRQFAEGNFAPLQNWLRANLYSAGEFDDGWTLVERICACAIDPRRLVDLLRSRLIG